MKTALWITICVCISAVFSKTLASVMFSDRDLSHIGGKFCGDHLSNMVSIVCRGKYNSPHKKSSKKILTMHFAFFIIVFLANDVMEQYEYGEEVPEEQYEYPFLPKRNAFMLLPNEKNKRGIVQECCVKACTLAELQSYCR